MREFVGVKSPIRFARDPNIKQEALIFNRIAIPKLNVLLAADVESVDWINEISQIASWLVEQRIIFQPEACPAFQELADVEHERLVLSRDRILEQLEESERLYNIKKLAVMSAPPMTDDEFFTVFKPHLTDLARLNEVADDLNTRCISITLRCLNQMDAYPITTSNQYPTTQSDTNKNDVIYLVLNTLPVPDESVSWEQILEYRSDPDSQSKFLALRYWMSEVARAELTPAEVEEKLEYLIDQYQKHMRLHRMKTNTGTLETVVTAGAEVLGDLVSFKWGKAAQALFSLKKREVALLEGELTAPGKEVAYIVKARETFGSA